MSEFNTALTEGIVCPYCGHEEKQPELDDEHYRLQCFEWYCDECLKEFKVQLIIEILFTTVKCEVKP
jgi:DNA-directed RNA polymerase subunit RPC12/RpoP